MSRQWRSDDTDKWRYGFGSGKDGSTYSVPTNASVATVSSGGTAITVSSSSFTTGDLVLIHQTRGIGVGSWELNKIASGGGTTSLTLKHALQNTYTDSGNSQAQIIELKEYKDLVLSGTTTVPAWGGNVGGIIAFLNKGTLSGSSGILSLNGSTGAARNTNGNTATTSGGGFMGGAAERSDNSESHGASGEGTGGASGGLNTHSFSYPGGNGGVRATFNNGNLARVGSGGGNGTAGGHSQDGMGIAVGNVALTNCNMGGGGGGSAIGGNVGGNVGAGGSGGGIAFIFTQFLDMSSLTIRTNGGNGGNGIYGGGEQSSYGCGGAGGSVLLKCQEATLGTNKVTASAGAAGGSGAHNGGVGRIHLDYSKSYTGTTSPTLNATLDSTIKPAGGGEFFQFF